MSGGECGAVFHTQQQFARIQCGLARHGWHTYQIKTLHQANNKVTFTLTHHLT